MAEDFTSGSFGEMSDSFSKFHDYQRMPFKGAGYSVLYTVLSGGRKLFLKALNRELGASAEHLARLRREYWILEKLYGNEHVVRCIGWREDAEVGPCIVMEYVDGESLTDYLKTNPSNKEKKRILNELLDALDFIHKHQIVHNDLKSENILVTRNGHNVKLIDFGYADGDSNIDKATGGTEAFASPELVRQETTDVRSDIYSLGFIIKALFPHCYGSVVRKCQHKEIEKRYQKVSEVGKAVGWRDRVKWFALAALAIAVAVWVWPRQETKTEQSIQVEAQSQLNLDSIHQVYQSVYDQCKDAITTGIADSSLKYIEFAKFHLYDFSNGMKTKYLEMIPEDDSLQRVFLNDYTTEYGIFLTRLESLCASMPSFYQVVNDDALLRELEAAYKVKLDQQMEILQRLSEMTQQKFEKSNF